MCSDLLRNAWQARGLSRGGYSSSCLQEVVSLLSEIHAVHPTLSSLFSSLFLHIALTTCSFEHLIKEFDANKDNKVSKDELLAGVEKHFVGKKPAELPGMSFHPFFYLHFSIYLFIYLFPPFDSSLSLSTRHIY